MTKAVFRVDVEGVGCFGFRRRTMGDECRITAVADRLIGDDSEGVSARAWNLAYLLAALKVLTEEAPDGWDPINADPGDPEIYDRIMRVWAAMQDAEARFRTGAGAGPQGAGAGAGAVSGVPVSPTLPVAGDGPAFSGALPG